MNVSLTPTLEELIRRKVESGQYRSASEVVREALRLLHDRDQIRRARLRELQGKVQVGLDEIERGESRELDEAHLSDFFEDVNARGRKRLAERRENNG